MTNTNEFTTMEKLKMRYSITGGAVVQYGPLVLATDITGQGEFEAEIYELVETPEESGVGIAECRLNFCEKAERIFRDGGQALEWCLKRVKEHYLSV